MNVHGLLYVSGDLLCLPLNYCEALWVYWVSCQMAMMVYGGWATEMFFQPVPECCTQFSYIFLWAVDVWAFKPVYDPTFLKSVTSVLGGHEKGFNGVTPSEVHLDSKVDACPFLTFPKSLNV